MDSPAEYEQYRLALGKKLKALRNSYGISGPELARRLSVVQSKKVTQSKIAKIENGRTTPSLDDVIHIVDVLEASPEVRDDLISHARELVTKIKGWKGLFGGGARQRMRQLGELQTSAEYIQVFQPSLVPGLLQTPEYARRSFETEPCVVEPENISATVAARLERQSVLYEPEKEISFVISEAVLRCEYGPRSMMAAQLDRILNVATLPNVNIHIWPIAGRKNVVPLTPFFNYGGLVVMVETFTDDFQVFDSVDVEVYEHVFQCLIDECVSQKKTIALIKEIKTSFSGSK